MKFDDIPQFTRNGSVRGNVSWKLLEEHLSVYSEYPCGFEFDPDFQRAHVWTVEQQRKYVEYILKGGCSGRDIYVNDPTKYRNDLPIQLVDGKQRITAVRKFLSNQLRIFPDLHWNGAGFYYSDFEGNLRTLGADFVFHENDLRTQKEVLQWYIDLNAGGTPHTDDEIEKVKLMIEALEE